MTGKKRINTDVMIMLAASVLTLAVLMLAYTYHFSKIPEAGTGEYHLPVFETSDVHGSFVGEINEPHTYRLAYIADKVNDARLTDEGTDPSRTVLLDTGDIVQGNPLSTLLSGEPMSASYAAMGYDAIGIGNHEFDNGLESAIDDDGTMFDYTTEDGKQKNDIPVINNDVYQDGKKITSAKDYVILRKTAVSETGETITVRIGVIGSAENYADSVAVKVFTDMGYSIEDDPAAVISLAEELETEERCDATILLTHGDAQKTAEVLEDPGCLDLVLGGHSHKSEEGVTESGLRYYEPSGKAYAYVQTELIFENDGLGGARIKEDAEPEGGFVKLSNSDVLYDRPENSEELDPEIISIAGYYIAQVSDTFSEEIGYITQPVTKVKHEESGKRTDGSGCWMADVLREEAGFDVVYMNAGGVRGSVWMDEGEDRHPVTLGDIYTMLPFEDALYCYEITYGELIDAVKFSVSTSGWNLLTCVSGIDVWFVDDPSDTSDNKYKRTLLDAVEAGGELIYRRGMQGDGWTDGLRDDWRDKKLRLGTTEFSATTDRQRDGNRNPLIGYNDTDRLYSKDEMLRDVVLRELRECAEKNDGCLDHDSRTHYFHRAYDGE